MSSLVPPNERRQRHRHKTTCSVALCTYNGEKYLPEQLASLRNQTLSPSEVIVCDDRSQDETVKSLKDVAAADDTIRVFQNERQLGVTQNFSQAVQHTGGAIVFLCDQDDVWEPEKIQVISQVFNDHPEIGYVFSDATRIGTSGQTLGDSLWQSLAIDFGDRAQRCYLDSGGFEILLRGYVVTGCTMALRAKFKELVLPIPNGWMHDAWIALCISAVSKGFPLTRKLVRYRQHASQQIGERPRSWYQQYLVAKQMGAGIFQQRRDQFVALQLRLTQQNQWPVDPWKLDLLDQKIDFLEARCEMRKQRLRFSRIARHAARGDYGKFAEGWKAICQDLMLP